MITLCQYQDSDNQCWSLEDDHGELYLMHVADIDDPRGRTSMSITRGAMNCLMAGNPAETPIADERQRDIEFRRCK